MLEHPILGLRSLCQALGIDPDTMPVKKIVLVAEVDSPLKVYVEHYLTKDQLEQVTDQLRQDHDIESIQVVPCATVEVVSAASLEVTACPSNPC